MTDNDYQKSIVVTASVEQAYHALTMGYENWWTKPDQPIQNLGDRAKFSFPPGQSYWTFEAVQLSPQAVVLTCVEAVHLHEGLSEGIREEWLGSQLHWSIEDLGEQRQIQLHHQGLTPRLECFDVCQAGWDFFFLDSLKAYLNSGVGKPHRQMDTAQT